MGKNKSFIKVRLAKLDKAIVYQVIDQNMRKTPRGTNLTFDIEGFEIKFKRSSRPNIKVDMNNQRITIQGRGNRKDHFLRPTTIYFEDNFDRNKIFNILVKSFEEVSKSLNN